MKLSASNLILGVIWLALIMALLASMEHTAWGFATINGGSMAWGYAQAVAIDLGMAALALAIRQRKIAGKNAASLWGGVVLFCLVSMYANLLYGTAHAQSVRLQAGYEWAQALVWLRPMLFSGVLPVLVVYLLEVVGERSHYQGMQARRVTKTVEEVQLVGGQSSDKSSEVVQDFGQVAAQTVQARRQHNIERVYQAVQEGCTKHVQIVSVTSFSRSSVSNYLNQLEGAGRIIRRSDKSIVIATPGQGLDKPDPAPGQDLDKS